MFKLVVLFAVAALAAAKPGLVAPVVYSTSVIPGISSVSQYSNLVNHGIPVYSGYGHLAHAAVVPAVVPYAAPIHSLHGIHALKKRSLVAPLAYTTTVIPGTSSVSQYSSLVNHGLPVYSGYTPLAHTAVLPAVVPYAAPIHSLHGIHALKKRSLLAPLAFAPWSHAYSPLISAYSGYSPLGYSAWGAKALSVHPY